MPVSGSQGVFRGYPIAVPTNAFSQDDWHPAPDGSPQFGAIPMMAPNIFMMPQQMLQTAMPVAPGYMPMAPSPFRVPEEAMSDEAMRPWESSPHASSATGAQETPERYDDYLNDAWAGNASPNWSYQMQQMQPQHYAQDEEEMLEVDPGANTLRMYGAHLQAACQTPSPFTDQARQAPNRNNTAQPPNSSSPRGNTQAQESGRENPRQGQPRNGQPPSPRENVFARARARRPGPPMNVPLPPHLARLAPLSRRGQQRQANQANAQPAQGPASTASQPSPALQQHDKDERLGELMQRAAMQGLGDVDIDPAKALLEQCGWDVDQAFARMCIGRSGRAAAAAARRQRQPRSETETGTENHPSRQRQHAQRDAGQQRRDRTNQGIDRGAAQRQQRRQTAPDFLQQLAEGSEPNLEGMDVWWHAPDALERNPQAMLAPGAAEEDEDSAGTGSGMYNGGSSSGEEHHGHEEPLQSHAHPSTEGLPEGARRRRRRTGMGEEAVFGQMRHLFERVQGLDGIEAEMFMQMDGLDGLLEVLMRSSEEADLQAAMLRSSEEAYSGGFSVPPVNEALLQQVTRISEFCASDEAAQCSVCLADFEQGDSLRTLECGHRFHVGCVDQWLFQSGQCPVCKKTVGAAL